MSSIEYNAMVSNAFQEAIARKKNSAGMSAHLLTSDPNNNIAKSLEASGRGAELSIEDIAGAMKAKNDKKQMEDDFLLRHIADSRNDEIQEVEANYDVIKRHISATEVAASHLKDKLTHVEMNTNRALARQEQVAGSLRKVQKNPFIK